MNTPSEETQENVNQKRKTIISGSSGGKTRRYSIGVTSSRKSIGEESKIIPNYLRASTGSCHDFCKFGKKHEHSKSTIPIKFKRTPIVNKEKLTKTVVPVERKKTTTVTKLKPSADPIEVTKKYVALQSKKPQVLKRILSTNGKSTEIEPKISQRSTSRVKPSPVTVNPDGPARSNVGIKQKDVKTVKKTEIIPKTAVIKKVAIESQSSKASFSRNSSLKAIKHGTVKKVSPLKDKNRLQKTETKQTISDKIQTKTSNGIEPESEVKLENIEFDFIHPASESFSVKNVVEEEFIEAESEVKLENIEFDFIHPDSESFSGKNVVEQVFVEAESDVKLENIDFDFIHPDSESFLGKNAVEEEFVEAESKVKLENFDFIHPDSESLSGKNVVEEELTADELLDKKLLEESLIAPCVVESSQSCSDKEILEEESLIAPPISESSESFYDEENVLEDESEYTDDDEEIEVSEEESETANNDETETSVTNHKKFSRKGRMVISEEKDDEAVKLRFRRGKVVDLKSENNAPRRLKFRKGKVMEGKEVNQHVTRRSFEKNYVEERIDSQNAPESVVLKHQGEQGKKDAQGLFNNVIEETASKLVESRKSKVKALVGAFETVISLQDGKL